METKTNRKTAILVCVMATTMLSMAVQYHVKVVDSSTGEPLSGIRVEGWISNDNGWKAWTEAAPVYHDTGITAKNGKCRLSGKTNTGEVGFIVKDPPAGYYPSPNVKLQLPRSMIENLSGLVTGGPEELLRLDRIENPIPLYVRNAWAPRNDKNVITWNGTNSVLKYDFIMGDWLPPAGNGKYADMVITTRLQVGDVLTIWANVKPVTFYDFISRIDFNGEGNGFSEETFENTRSGIKMRKAPAAGYQKSKIIRVGRVKRKEGPNIFPKYYDEYNKDRCYYFRIRSKFDNKGNLVEAYFGKVYGDFKIGAHIEIGLDIIKFLYYLNPTPLDRNLEWDMKNNLCPNPGMVGRQP